MRKKEVGEMEKEEKKLTEKWKDVVTDYLKVLSIPVSSLQY
jgi:hypothetical protein